MDLSIVNSGDDHSHKSNNYSLKKGIFQLFNLGPTISLTIRQTNHSKGNTMVVVTTMTTGDIRTL